MNWNIFEIAYGHFQCCTLPLPTYLIPQAWGKVLQTHKKSLQHHFCIFFFVTIKPKNYHLHKCCNICQNNVYIVRIIFVHCYIRCIWKAPNNLLSNIWSWSWTKNHESQLLVVWNVFCFFSRNGWFIKFIKYGIIDTNSTDKMTTGSSAMSLTCQIFFYTITQPGAKTCRNTFSVNECISEFQ